MPSGENATPLPVPPAGNVTGSENLVPKPEPDHGYAVMDGDVSCATAIAAPFGEKATPKLLSAGNVAGLANLVPKPEPDHGYAVTKGTETCATAIAAPSGEKATPLPIFVGSVAGLANLVPKPEPDHGYAVMYGDEAFATAIAFGFLNPAVAALSLSASITHPLHERRRSLFRPSKAE